MTASSPPFSTHTIGLDDIVLLTFLCFYCFLWALCKHHLEEEEVDKLEEWEERLSWQNKWTGLWRQDMGMGKPLVNLKTTVGDVNIQSTGKIDVFPWSKLVLNREPRELKRNKKEAIFFNFFLSNKWWPRALKWNLRKWSQFACTIKIRSNVQNIQGKRYHSKTWGMHPMQ